MAPGGGTDGATTGPPAPIADIAALSSRDRTRFGGKAALLGEMARQGLEVLPGAALSADRFGEVVESPRVALARERLASAVWPPRSARDREELESAGRALDDALLGVSLDDTAAALLSLLSPADRTGRVIVRSSATAEDSAGMSFAGQFQSLPARADPRDVAEGIRAVWRSACEPHVRAYLNRLDPRGASGPIAMGVVVQPFATFSLAGVSFSQHPAARLRGWYVLEYLDASPERIVSGEVTPHRCRVRTSDRHVVWERRVDDAPILGAAQLETLIGYGERMVDVLSADVDMEWGVTGERLYALQCRPATVTPWPEGGASVY